MCSAVFVLSVLVALDPVRIGIVALVISRPRPMRNLLAFWLGGMVAGVSVALVVLLFLRDFTLPLMRESGFRDEHPDRCADSGCDRRARGVERRAHLGAAARARTGNRRWGLGRRAETEHIGRIGQALDPRPA